MISYYGMSEENGLMVLEKQTSTFLGGGLTSGKDYSDKTSETVDLYVKELLSSRYEEVKKRLRLYKGAIEDTVKELFDKETIDGKDMRIIISEYEKQNGLESMLVPEKDDTLDDDLDDLDKGDKQA
eukprot:TRINITY_DN31343_c0_g1_i1.p2 TRINITY_DN31343_c0_g1~~TRINITY_DN31343_c0_g1_i1.p2  ORF type:complete len:145 (-),score=22.44 TRINITY_DN31343_c0_g1_i1:155-532(-)